MAYREISRVLSAYLFCFACALVIPVVLAFYFQFVADASVHPQPHSFFPFLITLGGCLALAGLFRYCGRKAQGTLYRREGLVLVVVIWFITALIGGAPFWVSGTLENPLDAYFESMSGLTTTGATVMTAKNYDAQGKEIPIRKTVTLEPATTYEYYGTIAPVKTADGKEITGVEAVGRALLFWRSFLQWIGGMGIVVLFLAVLPALGVGGKVLYQAEVPGPVKDSMTPRIRSTAGLLWKFYIVLTAVEVALLMIFHTDMTFFDAITVSFSNISTGGFSVRNQSIGSYQSAATEWIVIAFMLIGSINFVTYVHIIKRKLRRLWDPELLVYAGSLLVGCFLVVLLLIGAREVLLMPNAPVQTFDLGQSIRYGVFQLVSLQTSTGFSTADFNIWPFAVQVILLTVMFIGGMSGSTAGGIKIIRHTILVRVIVQRLEAIFRPHAVRTIHIGKSEVDNNRAMTVLSFVLIVITFALLGTFLLVVNGVDPETALSVNACMLNNIGVAFRVAGPTGSFAFLTWFGKSLSIVWMVLGRLEFFALLILLLPEFWRRT